MKARAHGIELAPALLDRALFLFSSPRDFELEMDEFLCQAQRSYLLMMEYYYRLYWVHYSQMNYLAWRSCQAMRMQQKPGRTLNATAEEFKPPKLLQKGLEAPGI